jgi:cyclic pyranopterin phosphate synthase
MSANVIPIVDQRAASPVPVIPAHTHDPNGTLADTRGRSLRDLRISVTDRCNFRCTYCMPKEVFDKDYQFLAKADLLNFEEITRMTRLFVAHGVEKIRLTGGEPLLRKHLDVLVGMLALLKTHDGSPLDIALTTNATLLAKQAHALQALTASRCRLILLMRLHFAP